LTSFTQVSYTGLYAESPIWAFHPDSGLDMPTTISVFALGAEEAVRGNTTNEKSTAIQIPTFRYFMLPLLVENLLKSDPFPLALGASPAKTALDLSSRLVRPCLLSCPEFPPV
jgi:hypothetical protein